MKVLHITNALGRKKAGGIGEVLSAFVQAQLANVKHLEVWHPNGLNESLEFANTTGLSIQNIKSFRTIGDAKYGISPSMYWYGTFNRLQFDIIHQHGIWLPSISLSALAIGKNSKKVLSPHGFLNNNALKMASRKKMLASILFEKRNIFSSRCLHACSTFEENHFRNYGYSGEIALIPNGISDEFLVPNRNIVKFRRKHKLGDSKILLFLSRIHPSKGLPLFIESMSTLKNLLHGWKLVIAGIDELDHVSYLKNLVRQKHLEDYVKFIGPVFGIERIQAYDSCDVFVLPSQTENFGIVIAQALSRKKPVLTTKDTPWEDLKSYNCGWWLNRTKQSFVNTLRVILNSEQKDFLTMGNNGFKLINSKYLWKSQAKKTVELYEYLLNDQLTRPSFIYP